MSEVPAEEYREYILRLLYLAKKAMEKRRPLFESRLRQVEYYISLMEGGKYLPKVYEKYLPKVYEKYLPKVYEVEPGHKIYWHGKKEFAPYTLILKDRVFHRQGKLSGKAIRYIRERGST